MLECYYSYSGLILRRLSKISATHIHDNHPYTHTLIHTGYSYDYVGDNFSIINMRIFSGFSFETPFVLGAF